MLASFMEEKRARIYMWWGAEASFQNSERG